MSLKITPTEIRQKSFEKVLRGYDKDEVAAFLVTLSKEWEKTVEENKELKSQIENAQKEIIKLREAESALIQSINDSEHSNSQMMAQVTQAAETQFKESQINAEAFIQEARIKARNLVEEAEAEAQLILDGVEQRLKELISEYKALANHKSGFSNELLNHIQDLNEKAKAFNQLHQDFNPEVFLTSFRLKVKSSEDDYTATKEPANVDSESKAVVNPSRAEQEIENKSFFDTIN